MGVKSLYYVSNPRMFAFASELKALLVLPEVPRRLNQVRVADYLLPLFSDNESTFFRDIRRLSGASTLTLGGGEPSIRGYWDLDPRREIRLRSDQEYADAFRDLFNEAVRCRLRSAFAVGSTLSGGLDSSSVACTARALGPPAGAAVHTFSLVFPTLPAADRQVIDEREHMQAVLASGGFQPHFIRADELSPMRDLERMHYHLDEANRAPNLYLHWAMFERARDCNVRVVLDGFDGDSAVSHGFDYLTDLTRELRLPALGRQIGQLSKHQLAGQRRRELVWELAIKPLLPDWSQPLGSLMRRHSDATDGEPLMAEEFRRQIAALRPERNGDGEPGRWTSTARARHAARLRNGFSRWRHATRSSTDGFSSSVFLCRRSRNLGTAGVAGCCAMRWPTCFPITCVGGAVRATSARISCAAF
jgi:asparagine synthetase B (glutamine-hydrolysing)